MYFQCLPQGKFLVALQPTLPTAVQNVDLSLAILKILIDAQELYSLASQKDCGPETRGHSFLHMSTKTGQDTFRGNELFAGSQTGQVSCCEDGASCILVISTLSVSSLRLVFLFSSEEPWKRDPVAGKQSTSSSEGEDPPGDPETLEAEVTPVSTLAHACSAGDEFFPFESTKCI